MATDALVVVPGDRLGSLHDFYPGTGTYVHKGFIYAAIAGLRSVTPDLTQGAKSTLHIRSSISAAVSVPNAGPGSHQVPTVGSFVFARVTRVTRRKVHALIQASEGTSYSVPFNGQIMLNDIRAYNVDEVKTAESFRAGDIIRAQVISTGDSSGAFLLSTADVECGVISCRSAQTQAALEPIAFNLMLSARTGECEFRKVARPSNADILTE